MDENILKILTQQKRLNDNLQEQLLALYTLCLALSQQVTILHMSMEKIPGGTEAMNESTKQLKEICGKGDRGDADASSPDSGGNDNTGGSCEDGSDKSTVVFPYNPN